MPPHVHVADEAQYQAGADGGHTCTGRVPGRMLCLRERRIVEHRNMHTRKAYAKVLKHRDEGAAPPARSHSVDCRCLSVGSMVLPCANARCAMAHGRWQAAVSAAGAGTTASAMAAAIQRAVTAMRSTTDTSLKPRNLLSPSMAATHCPALQRQFDTLYCPTRHGIWHC